MAVVAVGGDDVGRCDEGNGGGGGALGHGSVQMTGIWTTESSAVGGVNQPLFADILTIAVSPGEYRGRDRVFL